MEILGVIGGAVDFIGGLFGGNKGGYNANGVFEPGDWSSRQAKARTDLQTAGVTALVDAQRLDAILRMPSGWQVALSQYIGELQSAPKLASSGVSGIINSLTGQTSGGVSPVVLVLGALGVGYLAFKK